MTEDPPITRRRRTFVSDNTIFPDNTIILDPFSDVEQEDGDEPTPPAVIVNPRIQELEIENKRLMLENQKLRNMLRDPRLRNPQFEG